MRVREKWVFQVYAHAHNEGRKTAYFQLYVHVLNGGSRVMRMRRPSAVTVYLNQSQLDRGVKSVAIKHDTFNG